MRKIKICLNKLTIQKDRKLLLLLINGTWKELNIIGATDTDKFLDQLNSKKKLTRLVIWIYARVFSKDCTTFTVDKLPAHVNKILLQLMRIGLLVITESQISNTSIEICELIYFI